MTPELIERLRLHKPEVLVILKASSGTTITKTPKNTGKSGVSVSVTTQNQPKPGEVHVLRPGHPLTDLDHDVVFGTPPPLHSAQTPRLPVSRLRGRSQPFGTKPDANHTQNQVAAIAK